jgi:hypothetical protein
VVPPEDIEVSAEDQCRGVVKVLQQLPCLRSDALCVSGTLMSVIVLVRELVQVAALVMAEA